MGKSSKSRGKNIAKQERAMHLENVEDWKKTMSTIDNKFCTSLEGLFTNGKKRERVGFLQEQIQLTLNVEESFAFINRYKFYKTELSGVCSLLLFEQCLSAKYIQASNSYNEMMNYSLTEDFRFRMKPFSDLFLLWTGSGNVDKKEAIAKIIKNAFEVIYTHEANIFLGLCF
ncbi:predicted protein [Chaetoceros tenuissimus]|uniref:Uncharacterized protein n=1 Tax=Chaetoceros tenuissimus TaxID=426638 RepID=A0AAD3D2D6_9STRA|nr:predicted protein [Chaetoceros tenuissimus]